MKNFTARNNMRAMKKGDTGFFYHSNIGLEVVGIVEVCELSKPDTTTEDPRWDCVTIKAVRDFVQPVSLSPQPHEVVPCEGPQLRAFPACSRATSSST